jgi:4-amino-4-deoxy-L-arabinose transferase-like glycosyltransferase
MCVRIWTLASTSHAPYYSLMSLEAAETARNLLFGNGYSTDGSTGDVAIRQVELQRLIDIEGQNFPPGNKALDPTTRRYNVYGQVLQTYTRPWGFPLILAVSFALTGSEHYLPVQIVQVLLDTFAAVLVLLLGYQLLPKRAARFAALFYALFTPFSFLATRPLWDAYALPLTILALYFTVKAGKASTFKRCLGFAALTGLFIGIGYNFRFEFLVAPIFILVGLFPLLSIRRFIAAGLVITGITTLFVLPWAIRNHALVRQSLLTGTSAYVLVEGLGEQPDNPWGIECSDKAMNLEAVAEGFANAMTPEANVYFKRKYREAIEEQPNFFLTAALRRIPLALTSKNMEMLGPQFMRKTPDALLAYASARVGAPAILALAILGTLLTLIRRSRLFWRTLGLWVPAAFAIGTHIFTHWEPRYTVAAYLSYAWFAGLAIDWSLARYFGESWTDREPESNSTPK